MVIYYFNLFILFYFIYFIYFLFHFWFWLYITVMKFYVLISWYYFVLFVPYIMFYDLFFLYNSYMILCFSFMTSVISYLCILCPFLDWIYLNYFSYNQWCLPAVTFYSLLLLLIILTFPCVHLLNCILYVSRRFLCGYLLITEVKDFHLPQLLVSVIVIHFIITTVYCHTYGKNAPFIVGAW